MVLRPQSLQHLPFLLVLLVSCLVQVRGDDFDCLQTIDGVGYNFTTLGQETQVNRTRSTPPSVTIDSLTFNLCGDLKIKEGVSEDDQCPSGTRACLTEINIKGDERITSVIPLAQNDKLAVKLTVSPSTPVHLTLVMHGSEYPSKSTNTTPSVAQSLVVTLWCEPQEPTNITIAGYDGSKLALTYAGIAGCPMGKKGEGDNQDTPGGGDDKKTEEPPSSGVGWFFLLLLFAFIAYFSIGAYYNYATYGARGLDLIPHRDFWQEVPYMLSDVVSHLCSSAKPRRTSRNGYIQV